MRCGFSTNFRVYLTWHRSILYNLYYTTPKEEPPGSLVFLGGPYLGRTSMSC